MSPKKYVYSFEQGDGKNKQLLGGKGANLCEMTQIGLPVPPGFVITTEACRFYLSKEKKITVKQNDFFQLIPSDRNRLKVFYGRGIKHFSFSLITKRTQHMPFVIKPAVFSVFRVRRSSVMNFRLK